MTALLQRIREVQTSPVQMLVNTRIAEFHWKRTQGELFSELSFCLLTANTSAEMGIKCQNDICNGFEELPQEMLALRLKRLGFRFPNRRAEFIVLARQHKEILSPQLPRDWLVKNVKGLGMKEASHFLRNVGRDDVAIIDFHIVDLLAKHKLIKKPKTLTKSRYLAIEELLRQIAKAVGLTLAELDLYLWYIETGKVLK